MVGNDWLSMLIVGLLSLGGYGIARAKGKNDEEAVESVREASSKVADVLQKKVDEYEKRRKK